MGQNLWSKLDDLSSASVSVQWDKKNVGLLGARMSYVLKFAVHIIMIMRITFKKSTKKCNPIFTQLS